MISPIDFAIAERAWENIRQHTDDEFAIMRQHVEQEFNDLRDALVHFCATSPDDGAERLQNNFALSLGVTHFVSHAFMFYATIRSRRAFNEEEKTLGKELSVLLEQGMALIQAAGEEKQDEKDN
jgi:hypothetical protein